MIRIRTVAASMLALVASSVAAEDGFYQYPSARGDVLVFASEGDLWRSARSGGSAVRLTNHEAEESEAAVSPDGTMVAFTASYDSPQDVYVMTLAGGAPRRLTYEGGDVRTIGWTPDGRVIFSSRREGAGMGEVLYTVDPAGGEAEAIPLWRATHATFGADGRTLFFSRRGLDARARDNAVLYRGGGMTQLWRWETGSEAEAVQLLADFGASIRMPMASAGRIWFISDQSGADAVWSVAEDGSSLRQESGELPFPVLQASADGADLFLQNGADLHVFSTRDSTLSTLALDIVTDREQTRLRAIANPLERLEAARLSPDGGSVALTARGRVALGTTNRVRRVDYATPMEARARQAVAGPDGEWTYMILDRGERRDLYRMAANGTGEPVAITSGYDAHIWSFAVSPDGGTIVVWDKQARLQKVDVATGRVTLLAQNTTGEDWAFEGVVFSPAGTHIAYAEAAGGFIGIASDIFVQDLATGERVQATSGKYNDYAPAFAHDGAWLYFISDRNFDPEPGNPWGDRNMGVAFPDRGEIYALQLDPAAEFRFREDNELTRSANTDKATRDARAEEAARRKDGDASTVGPQAPIVFAGLAGRLYKVPVEPGADRLLLAGKDFLYTYRDDDVVSIAIDRTAPEVEVFARDARDFALSADLTTAMVVGGPQGSPSFTLVPAKASMPDDLAGSRVRLGDWRLMIDPVAEWRQMFVDAWRLHRDFAYDPALRGVDWGAVRAQHEPLLNRIGHRAELNTILGQMASQLGILHSQVRPGDLPEDGENGEMAFLGARYTPVAGGLRIDSIYRAEDDLVSLRPPLRRPGVDVQAGDIIRRVDGRSVSSLGELRLALTSKAGQQVRLDLARDRRELSTIVEPMNLNGETTASYFDFVEGRREATHQLSGGNIGYLHLRAMGSNDIASFARDWFALLDKDAIVIDVRNNGGGNVDSILIGLLMRRAWAYWADPRGVGTPTTNMQNAYRGHLAVLVDERTYSDGETFAAGIKSLGLAPLIGTRTAGAGIWLSDRNRLSDNGAVRIAEMPQYGIDGSWIIEGRGVDPDYVVENAPLARFRGEDAQLQAAVAVLREKIAQEPIAPLVPRPLPPLGTPGGDVRPLGAPLR